jgi:hypothetical protein
MRRAAQVGVSIVDFHYALPEDCFSRRARLLPYRRAPYEPSVRNPHDAMDDLAGNIL